jgi:hypothetical protein
LSDARDVGAFLKALGFSEELGTFEGRLRIQKSVYLLREFGIDLGFRHHWYIHGPYSPGLTRELFSRAQPSGAPRALTDEELRAVNEMRNFLGEDLYSADALELIVSLIFLIRYGPPDYDSKQKIVTFLDAAKPHFSRDQIDAAWTKIEESRRWRTELARLN